MFPARGNTGRSSSKRQVGMLGQEPVYVTRGGLVFRGEEEIAPKKGRDRRTVRFERDGKTRWVELGRLVLEAFVGPFDSRFCKAYVVGYRNGDKTDNRLANLYWRPKALRQDDPLRREYYHYGHRNGNFKYSDSVVRRVFDMRLQGSSSAVIAVSIGASTAWVDDIIHGVIRQDVRLSASFCSRVEFLLRQATETSEGALVLDHKKVWSVYKQLGKILSVSALVIARAAGHKCPTNWRHPKYWAGKPVHGARRNQAKTQRPKDCMVAREDGMEVVPLKDLPGMCIPQRPVLEDVLYDERQWLEMDSSGETSCGLLA